MAYQGGKRTNAEFIIDILNDEIFDNMDYLEPFLGYAHILRRIENKSSSTASDSNPLLMCLMNAVKKGYKIPTVTKKEYYKLKTSKGTSLKRAVAAFTYSFNGKEWGGYVGKYESCGYNRDPAAERKRYYDKLYDSDTFQSTKMSTSGKSYTAYSPFQKLIYCDPPYAETLGYRNNLEKMSSFDSDKFWNVIRHWSKNNIVFVSEYKAPKDFVCIASTKKHLSFAGRGNESLRTERLFIHKSCKTHLKKLAEIQEVSLPKWLHKL